MKAQCARCQRPFAFGDADADDWNVDVKGGHIVAILCPQCQTVEEDLEAQVNLATIEYLGTDAFGRVLGRPKS